MDESSTSNPLPASAEHSPAPAPAEIHDSNPLPAAEIPVVQNPVITDHADSNPLPENQPAKPVPATQNDRLVPAIGYLPAGGIQFVIAMVGLLGQNKTAKFHGAQSLLYWFLVVVAYFPVLILSGSLGALVGGAGVLVGFLLLGVFGLAFGIAVPVYMALNTLQGNDVRLPLIGNLVTEKIG